MKKILSTAIFSLILSSNAFADKVLVLGDSLSAGYRLERGEGWVELMEEKFKNKHEIINASVSGETSGGGLSRLPELLKLHLPDYVMVELGANDGLRGTPLKIIDSNLNNIANKIHEAGAKMIVIGIQLPPNYGPRYTRSFFNLYPTLANKYSSEIVPFLLEGVATDWNLMQQDGLHPTAEAQPLILNTVLKNISLN